MSNKVILLTGTSSGVGLATAITLAQQGHQVVATMRNLDKRASLDDAAGKAGISLDIRQLDVCDANSVTSCVDTVIADYGRIDTLINNAGAGFVRSTEQASEEEIQWVTEVNYLGTVRCTKAVLPYMRKARKGHVINITSVGGLVGQPFNELYCAAKFAVEGYTESLASYLTKGFGIQFTAIEPGGIASEFANNVMKQISETGGLAEDEYRPLLDAYLGAMRSRSPELMAQVYQTPDQVAQVIANCVQTETPPIRLRTSEWAESFCQLKTGLDPDGKQLQKQVSESLQ